MTEIKFQQFDNTVICFVKNIMLNLSHIKSVAITETELQAYGTDGRINHLSFDTKEDSSVTPIILPEGKKATS